MPFDTERFIMEIQNRPFLWNMSSEEYSNRVLKQSGWNEIADIVYGDWQILEENTKRKRIKDLQKKWKGLRDYYNREKNKDFSLKSGSETPKKRKAPYLDMLQFLNVSGVSNRSGVSNNRTSRCPVASNTVVSNISADTSSNSMFASAMFDESFCTNSVGNLSPPKKMTEFQEALLKSMEKSMENDPDMNFLLNILSEMKTMSPAQNFEFRFEVMKLIKNLKY